MKNIQKSLLILTIIFSSFSLAATAQIFVNIRPVRIVTVRTVAPAPTQVWVEEDWRESDGRYEWNGGHWEAPPRENVRYRNGYWKHSNHGHQWVRGGWYSSSVPVRTYKVRNNNGNKHGNKHDNRGGEGHGKGNKGH